MSIPLAIITGGSSGIGLALAKHLLAKAWNVALLDIQAPREPLSPAERVLFIQTDVADWASNAAAFAQAFAWGGDRLDFVALNAGIDDRDDIFHSLQATPPRKPNMLTFEININGVYYGAKLAAHYLARNTPVPGGKIVMTASATGLRRFPSCPQYCASKHAVVGLARSLGSPGVSTAGNVTVNAICPMGVATGILPPEVLESIPSEHFTPMSTVLRAFDELAAFDGVSDRETWTRSGKNGEVVETSLGNLYYRQEVPVPDMDVYSQGPVVPGAKPIEQVYLERNQKFANSYDE